MALAQHQGVCIELPVGDVVDILMPGHAGAVDSGRISITVEEKSGKRARLRIKADESVTISRRTPAKRAVPA